MHENMCFRPAPSAPYEEVFSDDLFHGYAGLEASSLYAITRGHVFFDLRQASRAIMTRVDG